MTTPKTAQPAQTKAKAKATKKTAPVDDITNQVAEPKGKATVQIVGGLNLKRKLLTGDFKKVNFVMSEENFLLLNAIGFKHKVTWDEVLRGLIEQAQASGDPSGGLIHFIPALQ